jgi:DNA repair protein RadC
MPVTVTYPEGGIVGVTMRQEQQAQQKTGNGNNHNNNHMNNVRVQLITTRPIPKTKLSSPQEVANYARSSMENLDREYAKVILLDTKNQVLGTETISIGSLNASIVHPREAVTSAVLSKSASVLFLHNHPSGSCEPSSEDREIAGILTKAFSDLGIKLLDSIIIGKGCYFSFMENNPSWLVVTGVGRSTETWAKTLEHRDQYRIAEPVSFQNGNGNQNQISQSLEKISVDTDRPTPTQEYQVIGAATPINGHLLAYHLTDNPDEVIRRLRADNLVAMNPHGDLGGGFYVSSVPQYWRSRSSRKWEFATNLNMQQRQRLVNVILSDPNYRKGGGYLADFEVDHLHRDLNTYITTGDITYLVSTSNQPYNVTVTEEITKKAGLSPPREPGLVEVHLKGKFIDGQKLYGNPNYREFLSAAKSQARSQPGEYEQNIINTWLNSMGYSGIFTKSGFNTNPEMVVWDRKAIVGIRKVT